MSSSSTFGGSGGSGGSSRDPFRILGRVSDIIQDMGWTGLGKVGVGTIFINTIFLGVDFLNALVGLPITLLQSLGADLSFLNRAFIRAPAEFLISGIAEGAASFGAGWTGLLGPFQGPFAVALTGIMVWEALYLLDVTDSDFFGTVLNVPLLESEDPDDNEA